MTFNMNEAWREATAMLSANREVLLVIAGIFFFLPSLISGFAMPSLKPMFADPDAMQAQMAAFYADYWWVFLLVLVVQLAGYLALLSLLRDHRRPTVGEAISTGLKGLLPAVATMVVLVLGLGLVGFAIGLVIGLLGMVLGATGGAILGVLLGLVLLVGLVFVLVRMSLWTPVLAIEKVFNPLRVLSRSWALTQGHALRLFLFYLLLVLVYIVITIVVGLVVGALTFAIGESGGLIVNAVLSGLIGAIAAVIYVAVLAAVHRQLSGPSAAAVSETFE